jgi:YVTN family beta-propeller protein
MMRIRNLRIGVGLLALVAVGVLVFLDGQIAVTQPGPLYAYVPNAADGTVSAIDLSKNEVAWTIVISQAIGDKKPQAAHGIAASPDGKFVYAGDATAKQLVIIDTIKREIVTRVPLEHGVHGIDISPDGRYVWVGGGLADYSWLGAVSVVNTATRQVETIVSPGLGSASHFAVTPDGKETWIASVTTNLVWIVNAASREVIAAVPLTLGTTLKPGSPEGQKGLIGFNEVAISPDGKRAYAVGPESATVYAIDVATRKVLGTAKAGERAHGITVSRDGKEVWTANRSGSVTVLDAQSLKVLATIPMGEYANHVAFSLDGKYAYVSRQEDVAVVDTKIREIVKTIKVGKEPHEISLEDLY